MNEPSRKGAAQPRVIRVFISSTFRDMQEERNHLVKFIFPELRKLCEQRGVVWGEVDLRWGVTTEQAAEGRVLPICLEEIRRCRPYFIGLLGERYGWVPRSIPDELLEKEAWLREQFQQALAQGVRFGQGGGGGQPIIKQDYPFFPVENHQSDLGLLYD